MNNPKFAVGDTVRIHRDYIHPNEVVKIVKVHPQPNALGNYIYDVDNLGPDSLGWSEYMLVPYTVTIKKAELESEPTPQPKIFSTPEEAVKGNNFIVGVRRNDSVRVAANYRDKGNQKTSKYPIYLYAENVAMSIEEAKEVAVALFNQILYHESLRNND